MHIQDSSAKKEALEGIKEQLANYYTKFLNTKEFIPGKSTVPVSGKIYDEKELMLLLEAVTDCWWTEGRFTKEAQQKVAQFVGRKFALLCNSGSSANLLALTALTSPLLEERRLKPGDEVLSVAGGFPTTVNPIVQIGCIPVFVDVDLETYNVNIEQLEKAITPKTKAIMLAHTLGNMWNVDKILELSKKHNLWIIEDSCDALGSVYDGKKSGTIGDISTLSFYPAHHITCGEGGAVLTNDPLLKRIIESFRDWGRDCWCPPGKDNTCRKRFSWKFPQLPEGYDHKYVYSHIGYNLKLTDFQGALLLTQLEKAPGFIKKRKENFVQLHEELEKFSDKLILPKATPKSEPSWFGFPISIKKNVNFSRRELVAFLEERGIATRMLFAGNLTKQPAFEHVNYRIQGELTNTDYIMENTFWIGVWPGITKEMIEYIAKAFLEFFEAHK